MGGTALPGWWRTHVVEVRDEVDAAAADPNAGRGRGTIILVTAALCLVSIAYLGRASQPQWFPSVLRAAGFGDLGGQVDAAFETSAQAGLYRLGFWGAVRAVGYVLVPMAVIRFALRGRPSEFGWQARGFVRHSGPYLVLLAVAVPFVIVASFGAAFQARYPFYALAPGDGLWPYVIGWWAIYAVQFVGVEFFFRGFLVLGLAPRFGFKAVLVAAVPYVMIHYAKPLPEMVGALFTGVTLGTLVLRSRSIWWGVVIHVAAAVLLDALALHHKGFL